MSLSNHGDPPPPAPVAPIERGTTAPIPRSFLYTLLLGAGFFMFVAWDQSYWWRNKEDYGFGWLVPVFAAYVVYDRWPRIRAMLVASGNRKPETGDRRAHTEHRIPITDHRFFRLAVSILAALCAIWGVLWFLLGAFYRASAGPSNPGTLAITMGAVCIVAPLLYFEASGADRPRLPDSAPVGGVPSPRESESSPVGGVPSPREPDSSLVGAVPPPREPESSPVGGVLSPRESESSPVGGVPSPRESDSTLVGAVPPPRESADVPRGEGTPPTSATAESTQGELTLPATRSGEEHSMAPVADLNVQPSASNVERFAPPSARLRLLLLFTFPLLVWFVSAPLVSVIESTLSRALLHFVVSIVRGVFDALELPIAQRGNVLVLPTGEVGMVEACSGIRSLTGCVFAGSFLAATMLSTWRRKLLLVVLGFALAIVSNLGRALFLTSWAYRNGALSIEGTLHDATGYAVLIVTTLMLLAIASALARTPRPVPAMAP